MNKIDDIPQTIRDSLSRRAIQFGHTNLRLTKHPRSFQGKHYLDVDPGLTRLILLTALSGEAQSRGVFGEILALACT